MNAPIPARTRIFGIAGLAGVLIFAASCLAVQFLRTDLDWTAAPLSYYLTGAYGGWVQTVYVMLAISLAALGAGFYRDLSSPARSSAPLALFVIGAVALVVTALSESAKERGDAGLWLFVHLAAAETTFLCVTVAMLLQSWRLRDDARWQSCFSLAFGLAIAAFAALWIYSLFRFLPRGLMQKSVIVLILVWLGWASIQMWRKALR